MNETTELLIEIHQTAELGKEILGRMIKRCEDASFRNLMADHFAEYHAVQREAQDKLSAAGISPEGLGYFEKSPIFASLSLHLKVDATSSHMAEMLVRGNVTGAIDTARALRKNAGAEAEAAELAERLKNAQVSQLEQLLSFV